MDIIWLIVGCVFGVPLAIVVFVLWVMSLLAGASWVINKFFDFVD